MNSTTYEPANYASVEAVYTKAQKLERSQLWNIPNYSWNVTCAQSLQQMPLQEMEFHLKQLIAAKVSMEKLNASYQNDYQNLTNNYNEQVNTLDDNFKTYAYLERHPQEVTYRNAHEGKLPETIQIDGHRKRPLLIALVISGILIILGMSINDAIHFLPINVISVIIFALATLFLVYILPFLFIFSLFGWSISQPWLVLNNIYQRWHKKQILNNDKSYCRTHDRSDDTLHKEMKYEESFVAHCSSYVTQMNQLQMQTEWQAKKYSKVVNDHVTLFPQDDTANMGHLLHIFQAIETGKATSWKDASVFVAQYEQQDRNTQTLAHAINQSTHQIVNTVNQARDQMMNQFASEMSEISGQIEHETNAINYWGGVQTSIAAYQTDLMQKANNR